MEPVGDKSGGGNGGAKVGARWNPTKEQIGILESLYKQGIRTPTAEQIQDITTRLKVYGHIEGKNVFYWFQNHKARLRQKQRQDQRLAFLTRFAPLLPYSPTPNVMYEPYNHQQPLYNNYNHALMMKGDGESQDHRDEMGLRTLNLFPLHPTGLCTSSSSSSTGDKIAARSSNSFDHPIDSRTCQRATGSIVDCNCL